GTQISSCLRKNLSRGMRRLSTCCSTKMSTQVWWLALTMYHSFGSSPSSPSTSHSVRWVSRIQALLPEIQLLATRFSSGSSRRRTGRNGRTRRTSASANRIDVQKRTLRTSSKAATTPRAVGGRKLSIRGLAVLATAWGGSEPMVARFRDDPDSGEPALATTIVLDFVVVDLAGAPEVELLHVRIALEGVGGPAHDDVAVLEQVGVVDDVQRRLGVLLDEQHAGAPLAVDLADDLEDLLDEERREPEGGLVEHDQPGLGHQGARDREHLLLAPREVAGLRAPAFREAREVGVGLVAQFAEAALRTAAGVGGEQVVVRREVLEDAPALEHVHEAHADPVRRAQRDDVLAGEVDLAASHGPALGRQQPADRLERGGLAGAVGAEEGDHAALLDIQRHPLDGEEHPVVGDLDIVEGQQAHFLAASSLTSFHTRSCSALYQSLSGFHFSPSHSEMRPLPPPWWSSAVSVSGGIRPSAS